jgi:outer membrane lipoprotein-sorting protein
VKQASFLPLWETPLWFLIREQVTLSEDVVVSAVEQSPGALRITIADKELSEAGSITLVFSDRPLDLKKWEITDAQGILTQVSLINPRYGVEIDPQVFDYGDLEIQSGAGRPERD